MGLGGVVGKEARVSADKGDQDGGPHLFLFLFSVTQNKQIDTCLSVVRPSGGRVGDTTPNSVIVVVDNNNDGFLLKKFPTADGEKEGLSSPHFHAYQTCRVSRVNSTQ